MMISPSSSALLLLLGEAAGAGLGLLLGSTEGLLGVAGAGVVLPRAPSGLPVDLASCELMEGEKTGLVIALATPMEQAAYGQHRMQCQGPAPWPC